MAAADEAYYIQAGLNILSGKLYPAFGEAQAGQPYRILYSLLDLASRGSRGLAAYLG